MPPSSVAGVFVCVCLRAGAPQAAGVGTSAGLWGLGGGAGGSPGRPAGSQGEPLLWQPRRVVGAGPLAARPDRAALAVQPSQPEAIAVSSPLGVQPAQPLAAPQGASAAVAVATVIAVSQPKPDIATDSRFKQEGRSPSCLRSIAILNYFTNPIDFSYRMLYPYCSYKELENGSFN